MKKEIIIYEHVLNVNSEMLPYYKNKHVKIISECLDVLKK